MPITHVFWSPTKTRTIDEEHPTTGRGVYSGLTLQELNTREGVTLQRMTWEEAYQLQTEADRARYCTGADEVTAERADDALCCLPPYRWTRTAGVAATSWEAFAIGEPLTGDLRTWFVRLGHRWFELIEDRAINYADLIDAVKASPAFHRAEA